MRKILEGKSILITGGTGSLGSAVVKRIATGVYGGPHTVAIFSRDELKQSIMASEYKEKDYMKFIIGDVRDYHSMYNALWGMDYVIHAAAMKRVGECNRFPIEAILTNCMGMVNLLNAIKVSRNQVECVINISSDKGADPLNMYGITKAAQEQCLIKSNYAYPGMRFACVRYGNVVGSRGSVIPIWQAQIKKGIAITVTDPAMTRFFITLDQAVDVIFEAIANAKEGDIYVPHSLPAATLGDLSSIMVGGDSKRIAYIGKESDEKMHETLVTNEESTRTITKGKYYVITSNVQTPPIIDKEYVSKDYLIPIKKLRQYLEANGVIEC